MASFDKLKMSGEGLNTASFLGGEECKIRLCRCYQPFSEFDR